MVIRQAITRTKRGRHFSYFDASGAKIDSAEVIERINKLAIPPAWKDVQISSSAASKVQAQGLDAAGRLQYIYSPAFRARQEAAKFDRVIDFGKKLPKLRARVVKDLRRRNLDKRKVTACAVQLMDEAYFRVGNQQYANRHQTYGLTTLRSKHLEISGETIEFDFVGKSHQHQHKKIKSRSLARMLKQLDETPGYELFRYYGDDGQLHNLTSTDINQYIKDVMGEDFTAKDFRTWGGTLLACMALAKSERPEAHKERQKVVTKCVKKVAFRLGNTPSVTRKSYIDPRMINFFNESDKFREVYTALQKVDEAEYNSTAENCALKILGQRM